MKTICTTLLALTIASGFVAAPVAFAKPPVIANTVAPTLAVGPQYDTTHVYVAPEDFDRFTDSFVATFGGSKSKQGVFQVTPTPSQTMSQLVFTPSGTISVFGFKTPIPWPFGTERTGYLVTDMDTAMKVAREHGADVIVDTFSRPDCWCSQLLLAVITDDASGVDPRKRRQARPGAIISSSLPGCVLATKRSMNVH